MGDGNSLEHFKRVQRLWAIWGAVIWIVAIVLGALAPRESLIIFVSGTSLLFLALLGALAARAGGASVMPSAKHNTGHVLEYADHGDNRRRRGLVRNRGIRGTTRRLRKLRLHADSIELLHAT
jgi:hypothetical protein